MENKIATTIEQSKKLLELGIDPSTADMLYCYDFMARCVTDLNVITQFLQPTKGDIPAWSLSALLNLLPLSIPYDNGHCRYFLEWIFWNDNSLRYINPPYSDKRECLVDIYSDHDEKRKDFIDTAFKMIVYLKENKLI